MQPERRNHVVTDAAKPEPAEAVHDQHLAGRYFAELVTTLEAQQAELAELREQLLLREAALNTVTGNVIIVRHTDKGSVIEYCNNAVLSEFGFGSEELFNCSVSLIFPDWSSAAVQQQHAAMRTGETVTMTHQLTRNDGNSFSYEIGITPIPRDAKDRVTHSLLSMTAV